MPNLKLTGTLLMNARIQYGVSIGASIVSLLILIASSVRAHNKCKNRQESGVHSPSPAQVGSDTCNTDGFTANMQIALILSVILMAVANALMFSVIYADSRTNTNILASYDLVIVVYALLMLIAFYKDSRLRWALVVLMFIVEVSLATIYIPYI